MGLQTQKSLARRRNVVGMAPCDERCMVVLSKFYRLSRRKLSRGQCGKNPNTEFTLQSACVTRVVCWYGAVDCYHVARAVLYTQSHRDPPSADAVRPRPATGLAPLAPRFAPKSEDCAAVACQDPRFVMSAHIVLKRLEHGRQQLVWHQRNHAFGCERIAA